MSDAEWILPNEAVLRLSGVAGGDGAARDLIAKFLGSGRIRTVASWLFEEPDAGKIEESPRIPPAYKRTSLYRLTGDGRRKVPIGSHFWVWSEGALEDEWGYIPPTKTGSDFKRWDWDTGVFVVFAPPLIPTAVPELKVPKRYRLGRRHIAYGVRLAREDVQLVLEAHPKDPPKLKSPQSYDFEPALWELLKIASTEGLESRFRVSGDRGTKAKIANWICAQSDPHNSGVAPADTWLKGHARMVAEVMDQAKLLKSSK